MKKCILGLCFLGLTNLICAQDEFAMNTSNYSDFTTKTLNVKNEKYLNYSYSDVQQLAARIKTLQKIAADYDITEARVYSKRKTVTYDVVFKTNKNFIKAIYDYKGTIISSEEYYEDVRIPYAIASELAKTYSNWSFGKSSCNILYSVEGDTSFVYNIELIKGDLTKMITRSL